MAILTGFTRTTNIAPSPIVAQDLLNWITSQTGKTITYVEIHPTGIDITGTIVSGDTSAIQTAIDSYVYSAPLSSIYVPQSSVSNASDMTADSSTNVPSQHQAYTADLAILAVANKKTSVRFYLNGSAQNGTPNTGDIVEWIETQNTASGNAVFNLTTDRTSGGTAICSSVFSDSIQTQLVDSSNLYAQGVPTVTTNKSVSVPIKKQAFTGVTLLSTNLLGSVAMNAAPDGIVVKFRCVGIAA